MKEYGNPGPCNKVGHNYVKVGKQVKHRTYHRITMIYICTKCGKKKKVAWKTE